MIYEDERSSENPIPCITIEDDVSIDQPNHEKYPIQVRKDLYEKDVSIECVKSDCESPGPSGQKQSLL